MTFPVVEQISRGNAASNSTSLSVTMPATVNAGDLLIILIANDGNPTVTRNNALAQSFANLAVGNNGSATKLTAWWKLADGSEDGAAATFTLSASEQSAWQVYRISGASASFAPVASTPTTGTSTAPDAGDCVPGWATGDTLWLTAFGADANSADGGSFAYPTNYATNGIYDEANNSTGCGLGSSYRTNAAASEDVGAWTINASEQWVAVTLAIPPSDAAFPPGPRQRGALTSGLSGTCTKPTGVVSGDLILFFAFSEGDPGAPSGFSQLSHVSNSVDGILRTRVFYKIAGGSEPASYTSSGSGWSLCVAFQTGTFDASDPFGAVSGNSGNSATVTYTGVNTDAANALLVAMGWSGGGQAPSNPSGMTSLGTVVDSGAGMRCSTELIPSAGATGNRTASISSEFWNAHLFSINATPAPSAATRFFAQLIG